MGMDVKGGSPGVQRVDLQPRNVVSEVSATIDKLIAIVKDLKKSKPDFIAADFVDAVTEKFGGPWGEPAEFIGWDLGAEGMHSKRGAVLARALEHGLEQASRAAKESAKGGLTPRGSSLNADNTLDPSELGKLAASNRVAEAVLSGMFGSHRRSASPPRDMGSFEEPLPTRPAPRCVPLTGERPASTVGYGALSLGDSPPTPLAVEESGAPATPKFRWSGQHGELRMVTNMLDKLCKGTDPQSETSWELSDGGASRDVPLVELLRDAVDAGIIPLADLEAALAGGVQARAAGRALP